MADMGLISIRERAKDYYAKEKQRHKNYLNQQFHTTKPNEIGSPLQDMFNSITASALIQRISINRPTEKKLNTTANCKTNKMKNRTRRVQNENISLFGVHFFAFMESCPIFNFIGCSLKSRIKST